MNISIRQIEHFIAVAQELHFRRAAELANVAQPALSRSVQTLENELGVQLLARNNRNVRLTAAGKEFLAGCTGIVEAMELTMQKTVRVGQMEVGGLHIGYTYVAMSGVLPKLMGKFEALHPNIALEPVGFSTTDQLEHLHHNELDVCFLTGPVHSHEVNTALFQSNEFFVIASDRPEFTDRTSIDITELKNETILLPSNEIASSYNQHVHDLLRQAAIAPKINYIDQDHVGLLGKAALNKGICIATEGFGSFYSQNLKTLKLTGVNSTLPTVMAWRKDLHSESLSTFCQFIIDRTSSSVTNIPNDSAGIKKPDNSEITTASEADSPSLTE